MEIAAHKTYLVYAAFWCSENCAAKCWKQAADNRTLKTVPYKITKITPPRETSAPTAGWLCIIYFRQYRIILSADTASEVRQMPSQKRR